MAAVDMTFSVIVDTDAIDAAGLSFGHVVDTLGASDALRELVAEGFPDIFERGPGDGVELIVKGHEGIVVQSIASSAGRAGEVLVLTAPTQRYRELVAAIAAHGDLEIGESHGWPILSVVGGD